MSGKKKRKKKKKGKAKATPLKKVDYEGFRLGPIKVERFGRLVNISSDYDKHEFEKHLDLIKKERPKLKSEINDKIQECCSTLRKYEPLQLLSVVTTENCLGDPESYAESTHKGREAYAEYCQSLLLAVGHDFSTSKPLTEEIISRFKELIEEIFNQVFWYFCTEPSEFERTPIEHETRLSLIGRHLFIRGDSYVEHQDELVRDLFLPYKKYFLEKLGIDVSQILDLQKNLDEQLQSMVGTYRKLGLITQDLRQKFLEFFNARSPSKEDNPDLIIQEFQSIPEVQRLSKESKDLYLELSDIPYEVKPNENIPAGLLDQSYYSTIFTQGSSSALSPPRESSSGGD